MLRVARVHDYELTVKLLPLGEELSRNPERFVLTLQR